MKQDKKDDEKDDEGHEHGLETGTKQRLHPFGHDPKRGKERNHKTTTDRTSRACKLAATKGQAILSVGCWTCRIADVLASRAILKNRSRRLSCSREMTRWDSAVHTDRVEKLSMRTIG